MNADQRKLQRELAEHLREKDRAALGLLRAKVRVARLERKHMLTGARQSCRTARVELVAKQRTDRERLRDIQRAEREQGKGACESGKLNARRRGAELEAEAARSLVSERADQRLIRRAGKPVKVRATARELAQEDDDRVRSNLPAELLPVFEIVKKKIRGNARRSRTEAFLEWAEENPGEVLDAQQTDADGYLRDLLKQQRELGKTVRKAGRYKQTPAELAEALAAVPF